MDLKWVGKLDGDYMKNRKRREEQTLALA